MPDQLLDFLRQSTRIQRASIDDDFDPLPRNEINALLDTVPCSGLPSLMLAGSRRLRIFPDVELCWWVSSSKCVHTRFWPHASEVVSRDEVHISKFGL